MEVLLSVSADRWKLFSLKRILVVINKNNMFTMLKQTIVMNHLTGISEDQAGGSVGIATEVGSDTQTSDAVLDYKVDGANWMTGIDYSEANRPFKIARTGPLGTGDVLTLDSVAGTATVAGNISATNTDTHLALEHISTSGNNTIQYGAGTAPSVSGGDNVLIGAASATLLAGGTGNVVIGKGSMTGVTIGAGNVVIGPFAGNSIDAPSSSNVCIGDAATTGGGVSESIAIGFNTSNTVSNTCSIGGADLTSIVSNGANCSLGTVALPFKDLIMSGDATIGGDLTINGTTTTVNTATLEIEDSTVHTAHNNPADTLDSAYFMEYNDGAVKYAGLVRDATDKEFYLFKDETAAPVEGTTYSTLANLNAASIDLSGSVSSSTAAVTSATASTSPTTGASVVTGGLGVGGDVNIGGDLATPGMISFVKPWFEMYDNVELISPIMVLYTWYKANFTSTKANVNSYLFTHTSPNKMTCNASVAKSYHMGCTFSGYPNGGLDTSFEFALAKNGIILPQSVVGMTTINNADRYSSAIHAIEVLRENDYIELYYRRTTSTVTDKITIEFFNMFGIALPNPTAFSPADIPDLVAWYDGDKTFTTDQTSNKYDLSGYALTETTVGGYTGAVMSGATSIFTSSGTMVWSNCTIFMVLSASNTGDTISNTTAYGSDNDFLTGLYATGGYVYRQHYVRGSSFAGDSAAIDITPVRIYSTMVNNAAGHMDTSLSDETSINTSLPGFYTPPAARGWRIGGRTASSFTGVLYNVILYERVLSVTERDLVGNYLASYYGINY